jgi:hypothetical protein
LTGSDGDKTCLRQFKESSRRREGFYLDSL